MPPPLKFWYFLKLLSDYIGMLSKNNHKIWFLQFLVRDEVGNRDYLCKHEANGIAASANVDTYEIRAINQVTSDINTIGKN